MSYEESSNDSEISIPIRWEGGLDREKLVNKAGEDFQKLFTLKDSTDPKYKSTIENVSEYWATSAPKSEAIQIRQFLEHLMRVVFKDSIEE